MRNKVIGWSCWGFLGAGITDTPDGGRCHRLPLLRQIISKGYSIVMLQENRDLKECGQNFEEKKLIFSKDFPKIDLLFLEYRWPIVGRNCEIDEDNKEYTPDLRRQTELVQYYRSNQTPIIAWDKDQKIPKNEEKLFDVILEASLLPKDNRISFLFPMSNEIIMNFEKKIEKYSQNGRDIDIIYIGNQYERDETFQKYFSDVLINKKLKNVVFGNWTKYSNQAKINKEKFPLVNFQNRIAYSTIFRYYQRSFVTPLLAPDRYYKSGQVTQRLFEAISEQCIPLFPSEYTCVEQVAIPEFIISTSNDVYKKIIEFRKMSDKEVIYLLKKQFNKIRQYSVKIQTNKLITIFNKLIK